MNTTIRDLYNPKVIIKRQSSTVSPLYNKQYNDDNISVDSFDRTSPSRQNIASPSNISALRSYNPHNSMLTAKNVTSPPWYTTAKGWLLTAGILTGISALIIIPTVCAVVLTRNPIVEITPISSIIHTAVWHFDNTVMDLNNTYNGNLHDGATYTNITYFGYGMALILNASSNSFVDVPSPFLNLSYTSFTIEAWILLTTISGDNAIFSQCECGSCSGRCLSLTIRNGKIYMAYSLNVLTGSTIMATNTWYHIAYVYDYSTRTQYVYLQGILDGTKTSSDPYQGQSGSILIGASNISSSLYNGYIDDLKVTTMAKSANDILDDATLMAYFSFDSSTLINDNGPNKIFSYAQNVGAISGKGGQALSLTGSSSYFEAYAFSYLSFSSKEFSIALWINPSSANGTLIQKTRNQLTTSGSCSIFIAFSTIGQIVFSAPTGASSVTYIVGPFISTGQWTHLGYTYSLTNGLTMYINGVKYGAATGINYYSPSANYEWLNIGQYATTVCTSFTIVSNGFYQGAIDEVYIYRRELKASAIASLAVY